VFPFRSTGERHQAAGQIESFDHCDSAAQFGESDGVQTRVSTVMPARNIRLPSSSTGDDEDAPEA
jgi:hypothetical protein